MHILAETPTDAKWTTMNSPMSVQIPIYARRLIPAILLAATATLSSSAIGGTGTACAAPGGDWDSASYRKCMESK